jgi:hypothetical protein
MFEPGQKVTWTDGAPKEWALIDAPIMTIVSRNWQSDEPSDYAKRFGIDRMEPGWTFEVTFDNDWYYDPPLIGGIIQVHGKWLRAV